MRNKKNRFTAMLWAYFVNYLSLVIVHTDKFSPTPCIKLMILVCPSVSNNWPIFEPLSFQYFELFCLWITFSKLSPIWFSFPIRTMMLKKVFKSLEEAVMLEVCRASFNLKYKFHKQVTYQIYDKNTNIYIRVKIRSYNTIKDLLDQLTVI